jgi:hypothetical protein
MRRIPVIFAIVATVTVFLPSLAPAQDGNEKAPNKAAAKASASSESAGPVQPYRLDFSFFELEDGKKINTRHFSLDLTAGSGNDVKIGTKVPVPNGGTAAMQKINYDYMDVGTRIWANLGVLGNGDLRLDVRSDVTSLDQSVHDRNPGSPPIVRQVQINGTTLLVTDKPILIGSMDDPNSNRQFQLEVTVTKLR